MRKFNNLAWLIALSIALATPCVMGDEIKIKALALFKNKAVLEINGKRRTLAVGKTSREGVELVAASSEKATVKLNDETLELKLNSTIGSKFGDSGKGKSFKLYPAQNGHYFVDGLINGNSIQFLVDTGATSVAINQNMAKKIGILHRVDGREGMIETASGVVPAYYVTFKEITIRSITLRNVPGVVIESDFPSIALLGQSFLNRLDLRRDNIVLELRER